MNNFGVKSLLKGLNNQELNDFSLLNEISESSSKNISIQALIKKFEGNSKGFYSNYLNFTKNVIKKKCSEEDIQFEVCLKILFELTNYQNRKKEQVIKSVHHKDFDTCLQLLIRYNIVDEAYRKNKNFYSLTIPSQFRPLVNFIFAEKGVEIDQEVIKSSLLKLSKDFDPKLIIEIIRNLEKEYKSSSEAEFDLYSSISKNFSIDKIVIKSLLGIFVDYDILNVKSVKIKTNDTLLTNREYFIDAINNGAEESEELITDYQNLHEKIVNLPYISEIAIDYFDETIQSLENNLVLSTGILLGCVSEIVFNQLTETIKVFFGEKVSKTLDNTHSILNRKNKLIDILSTISDENLKKIKEDKKFKNETFDNSDEILIKSEFKEIINNLFTSYRMTRNDLGHPISLQSNIDLVYIQSLVNNFYFYLVKIHRLIEIFSVIKY